MKKRKHVFVVLVVVISMTGALKSKGTSEAPLPLIPWPAVVESSPGSLSLAKGTVIVLPRDAEAASGAVRLFVDIARQRWGVSLKPVRYQGPNDCGPGGILVEGGKCSSCSGSIVLGEAVSACGGEVEPLANELPKEGYRLVTEDSVMIRARGPAGYQHGFMTLLQLISHESTGLIVPRVAVLDYPRHEWRGLMLDSSRSFIPPSLIKRFIDRLAELKMNVFHWHLTDDQGWRLESKAFPKLHLDGSDLSYLSDDKLQALKDYGWDLDRGYYTQDEVREIVAYAKRRNILIVPEIDIPGHSSAMLHAYPELSCSGKGAPMRTWTTIYPTALCPGKEEVYEFLDKLFAEVASLFPGPYVHIGSDEVVGADWLDYPPNRELMEERGLEGRKGLQSYFVKRVDRILAGYSKTMIAWDETASYLPEGAVCQVWRDHDYANQAAERGNDVIVSLFTPHYLNYTPFFHTMKSIYQFEQVPEGLAPSLHELVIGGEVCLWGRQPTIYDLEPRSFPRLLAFSESVWTDPAQREWEDYLCRLKVVRKRMESRGIEFGKTWQDLLPGG